MPPQHTQWKALARAISERWSLQAVGEIYLELHQQELAKEAAIVAQHRQAPTHSCSIINASEAS
jgi:hypothetical protein